MLRCTPHASSPVVASAVGRRALHTAAPLLTQPKRSAYARFRPQIYQASGGLPLLAARYVDSGARYNEILFGEGDLAKEARARSNVEITMKLLQQQLLRAGPDAKNILLSPITLAKGLAGDGGPGLDALNLSPQAAKRAKETDYSSVISTLTASGDVALHITSSDSSSPTAAGQAFATSVEAARKQEEALRVAQLSHLVKLPFPLNASAEDIAAREPIVSYTQPSASSSAQSSSSTAAAASSAAAPLTHALNFTGYLAPRFASPDTKFPNYFYDFQGRKRIAHMMVKTGKMWYIEHEKFQMVDLPYLNSNFVATLILPRVSSDRTIQDHPEEFEYDKIKRQASTVHDVLALLAAPHSSGIDVFSHHARYMAPMKGLVGVPGFTADYVMSEKDAGGQSDERHRAVLSISPHGLDVGVKTLRTRANHLGANFTALFDHPFLFFLRSTRPDAPQILFAGVVKDVFERRDWSTKYPLPQEWADFKEEIGRKIAGMYAQQQQQQQATGGAR